MANRRVILSAFFMFIGLTLFAQKVVIDDLTAKQSITLNGRKVTQILLDSTFAAATHSQVPTAKAVKDYVDANSGGAGVDTFYRSNDTLFIESGATTFFAVLPGEGYVTVSNASVAASTVIGQLQGSTAANFVMILPTGASASRSLTLPSASSLDVSYAKKIVKVSAQDSSSSYQITVVSQTLNELNIGGVVTTIDTLDANETAWYQFVYVGSGGSQWRRIATTGVPVSGLPANKDSVDYATLTQAVKDTIAANSIRQLGMIRDTLYAQGIAANESVTNYGFATVDQIFYKFSSAQLGLSGDYGGWLANGTSGDSIQVSVPFGIVFGDSQAEGHPALHGRLHPNAVATFTSTYPDSVGQLSYHLRQLTKMWWANQGIGGQTTDQLVARFDRDVLAITGNPITGADSRGTSTLNSKPVVAVIIAGINDIFTAGFTTERTKRNLTYMASRCMDEGVNCVMLNLPGDHIGSLTSTHLKYIQDVNDWLASGALNIYNVVVVDYNKWWKDPSWNDNYHQNTNRIVDDVHPSKAGYDTLATYIFTEAKLPVLRSAIIYNQVAPSSSLSGFSRPNSVRVDAGATYSLTNAIDSFIVTTPLTSDRVYFSILGSTNVTGTSYSGFSTIRWVIKNKVNAPTPKDKFIPISKLIIRGATNNPVRKSVIVYNSDDKASLQVSDGLSVWNNGKGTNNNDNTVFGNEAADAMTTGGQNTIYGRYAGYSISTSSNNSFFGKRAGFRPNGGNNTAMGSDAMYGTSGSTGASNAAFGNASMYYLTSGNNNAALGSNSMNAITSGSDNTGVGSFSLLANQTSSNNTAIGALSLRKTTAQNNTGIGWRAGFYNTTGTNNTFVGYQAGRYLSNGADSLQTATNSTYVGKDTKGSADGVTNENVIGYNAVGAGNNSVTLGNTSVTVMKFGNIFWYQGTGSPETVVTAVVGSLYSRTDGGANTTLYVKESGSGNTGWVAK